MVAVLGVVDVVLALQLLFVWWNLSGLLAPEKLAERDRAGRSVKVKLPERNHAERSDRTTLAESDHAWRSDTAQQAPNMDGLSSPTPGASGAVDSPVRLSVLIPARDEERNIEACLASVLAQQDVAGMEVLVLDDNSTDRTAALVQAIAGRDSRVRLLRGGPLPDGWTGKSFACHQLSQQARGEHWLFLDADARLLPGGLSRLVAALDAAGGGLVTGFPHQMTGSWLERLIVPLMAFTVACHLPIRAALRSPDPKLVAAHGACLLLHRATYRAIGGHAAFAGHLVDDMQLAAAVKRAGHPYRLADISGCVTMRMYHSADEVWRGYKKNLYAGVGRSGALLASVLLLYLALYVLPVAGIIGAVWQPGWLLPAVCGWLLGVGIKAAIDRKWRQSGWLAFTLPIAIPLLTLLAIDSWRIAAAGKRYEWKGRWYR